MPNEAITRLLTGHHPLTVAQLASAAPTLIAPLRGRIVDLALDRSLGEHRRPAPVRGRHLLLASSLVTRPPHRPRTPRPVASATPFYQVAWSERGDLLVALDTKGRLAAWRDDRLVAALELDGDSSCSIAVRPGGAEVAVARPKEDAVAVVDVDRGAVTAIARLGSGGPCDLAWSSDGRRLAVITRSGMVSIYDVGAGRREGTIREAGMGTSTRVAWSADGERIATLVLNTVRIWNAVSRKEIASATPSERGASPIALAFGTEGDRVVGAFERGEVFALSPGGDLASGKLPYLRALAFAPSGALAVACSIGDRADRSSWTLGVLDFPRGRLRHALCGVDDRPFACAFGPQGHVAGALVSGDVGVWEVQRCRRDRYPLRSSRGAASRRYGIDERIAHLIGTVRGHRDLEPAPLRHRGVLPRRPRRGRRR